MLSYRPRALVAALTFVVSIVCLPKPSSAWELLLSDRTTNRILRYDESGNFIDVLVDDAVNLDEPNGMVLSPDGTKLYVASRQNNSIVRYDYNGTSATNPLVITDSDINVPASLLFSLDGGTLYEANLGAAFDGATVGRFDQDGNNLGAALTGGSPVGRSGLAINPAGDLLVGSFQNGEVLRYNTGTSSFENFIGPNNGLVGVGYLLVHGNDLYVSGGFAGTVMKFDATTGAVDASFNVNSLPFPAALALGPDGNSLLVSVLGLQAGQGAILQYGFDGTPLGTFANNSADVPSRGFAEATGLLAVPEPSTLLLTLLGGLATAVVAGRRRSRHC